MPSTDVYGLMLTTEHSRPFTCTLTLLLSSHEGTDKMPSTARQSEINCLSCCRRIVFI